MLGGIDGTFCASADDEVRGAMIEHSTDLLGQAGAARPAHAHASAPTSCDDKLHGGGAVTSQQAPAPVDLLDAALARLRPRLADTRLSPRERLEILWSGAVAARSFAARDVWGNEFARLVVQTGLLRCLPRRSSAIIVCHVLRWAWLGRSPW